MEMHYFFMNKKLTLDMPICKPIEIKKHIKLNRQILALDLGSKRIGIAISNGSALIPTPLTTIKRKKFESDVNQLIKIIKENKVMALVIGLPLNMNGTEGRRCQSTRDFAKELLKKINIDLIFWDERLTTKSANDILSKSTLSREKKQLAIDKIAASLILENALEFIKNNND